jgi:xylitol oxidase
MTAATNWAGNLTYGTTRLTKMSSVHEALAWVKEQPHCKVLGTRHCFNDIADSKDELLSLQPMNQVAALHANAVTVEAGIRYGELAVYLNEKGYALNNLASLPHISVAGGCATATHGSGVHNANLSSAVRGMALLTASGDLRQLAGDELRAATVHLGALGIVTHLTLAIEPAYEVRQYVYEHLPMGALEKHFEEIMTAGYSVSLFTDWRNRNINEVWIKCREPFSAPPEFFGATAATRDLHPIHDMPAENCTPQMGVPGPWHERLPHFKMGFTPSSGKELQTEYFVPLEHAFEAIMAVEQLHAHVSPHLLVSEVRCIAADDLWLSPCGHRPSAAIHFTWKPEWEAVAPLLRLIEAQLAPYHARPHWGKLFSMNPGALYPKMAAFRDLVRSYDPGGKFRNAWLERLMV